MPELDVIIVGAGIAGSATAALLGREGFRVLLLEKAQFPREKICGEGLMPAGTRILEDLGILSRIRPHGQPFSKIHFHLPERDSLELDFREINTQATGWVLPRRLLDAELACFAARQPGVQFWQNFQVQSVESSDTLVQVTGPHESRLRKVQARLLIGADGIRSRFHNDFHLQKKKPPILRFALRALYESFDERQGVVEVHCCPEGEAYVAPMGDGLARITLLLEGPIRSANGLGDLYLKHLKRFPRLMERLPVERPQGEIESTGPVSLQVSRCHGERWILIGDAAGAADPITGQGMSLALQDAVLACEVATRQLHQDQLSERDLAEYTRRREAHFRPSFELAELFLLTLRHPLLARRTVRLLRQDSRLREKVLATAVSSPTTGSLTGVEKLRLLAGI